MKKNPRENNIGEVDMKVKELRQILRTLRDDINVIVSIKDTKRNLSDVIPIHHEGGIALVMKGEDTPIPTPPHSS